MKPRKTIATKVLTLVLSVLMVASSIPTSAIAEAVAKAAWTAESQETLEQVLAARQGRRYKVSFDANGGEGAMDPCEFGEEPPAVADGEAEEQQSDPSLYRFETPDAAFTREGYEFAGWSTTADGTDVLEDVTDTETGETRQEIKVPAVAIAPGDVLDRFTFPFDTDGDGLIETGEIADAYGAVTDTGELVLYAQWEEVPAEEQAEGSEESVEEEPSEEVLTLTGEEELVEAVKTAAPMKAVSKAGDVPSNNGTSFVDSVKMYWTGADGKPLTDPTVVLDAKDTTNLSASAMASVSLSGGEDYATGAVSVTIPKQIVRDRDGNLTGAITLAVPAAPSTSQTFNYTETADSYVLRNTRPLSGGTDASFGFTVKDISPTAVVSGAVSDDFSCQVRVELSDGTVIGGDSAALNLKVNTWAKVDNAVAVADKLGVTDNSFVPAELRLSGDWVYTSYKTYAHTAGSQPYDLSLKVADTSGITGARILGEAERRCASSSTAYGNVYTQWVYVAYPKSAFKEGNVYNLSVKCDWTLTGVDDKATTTQSAEASKRYSPKSFENPTGAMNVFKDGAGPVVVDSDIIEDGVAQDAGFYATALDDLAAGKDVDVSWDVTVLGFDAPFTWKDLNGDGKKSEEEYGQIPLHFDIDDTEVTFDHDKVLTTAEAELTRISVKQFTQRKWTQSEVTQNAYGHESGGVRWGQVEPGDWCYLPVDPDGTSGPLKIFVTDRDGKNIQVGSYDTVTKSYSPMNGATADEKGLVVPPGYLAWHAEYDTTADASYWVIQPTVRLKASSPKVKDAVAACFAGEDDPATQIDNSARMYFEHKVDNTRYSFDRTKTGRDYLQGLTCAVEATQAVRVSNDVEAQRAKLSYTTRVTKTSNLQDRASALAAGYKQEDTGTFWYLLAPGVVADTASFTVSDRSGYVGGSVTSYKVHGNWENTGRTMLEVHVAFNQSRTWNYIKDGGRSVFGEQFGLSFDATMTWVAMSDWGASPVLNAMYVSDNPVLANATGRGGEVPGASAAHTHSKDALEGSDNAFAAVRAEGPRAVYARVADTLNVDRAFATGLSKNVDVNGENRYSSGRATDERNVWSGGTYDYRLHVENDGFTRLTDIVLFDSLENFEPATDDAGDGRWKGELVSVDVAQLRAAGIDPVVYYSTRDDMVFAADGNGVTDLSDTAVWTTERPDHVGAVAIDCTRAADGSAFTLGTGASVSAYLEMRAPKAGEVAEKAGVDSDQVVDSTLADGSQEPVSGGYHAYNNVALYASKTSIAGIVGARELIHQDYTKVGLKEQRVEVQKSWNDGSNRDGIRPDAVTVRLLADGTDTGRFLKLTADNGWHGEFGDLIGGPAYSIVEDVPEGYSAVYSSPTKANPRLWTVTNIHSPELTEVEVEKVWNDNSNAAGRRPSSVTVGIYKTPEGGQESLYRTVRLYAPETEEGEVAPDVWSTTVKGLYAYENGKPVSYRVAEKNVSSAYTSETEETDGTWRVTNTYVPYGSLRVTKEVDGYAPEGATHNLQVSLWDRDGAPVTDPVTFELAGETSEYTPGDTIELPSGGSAVLSQVGEGWTYRVSELSSVGWSQVGSTGASGEILAGRTVGATLVNRYTAKGIAQVSAHKTLVGRPEGLKEGEFTFCAQRVVDGERTGAIYSAKNDADGNVSISAPLVLADAGQTVTWEVWEKGGTGGAESNRGITYDQTAYRVSGTVADDGAGTLTLADVKVTKAADNTEMEQAEFVNGYSSYGSFNYPVSKTWAGWADVFKALGADSDGQYANYSDVLPRAYTWGNSSPFTIEAVFENGETTYSSASPDCTTGVGYLQPSVSISSWADDGEMKAHYNAFGKDMDAETFFGIHRLKIREKADPESFDNYWAQIFVDDTGKRAEFAQAVKDAIIWDEREVEIAVQFVDRGNGKLSMEIVDGPETASFENGFKEGSISVEKKVEGDGDPNKQFHFHVEVSDAPEKVDVEWKGEAQKVTFNANGKIFGRDSMPYTEVDYSPDGVYGDGGKEAAGPILTSEGDAFLWWGDENGNKVDLASVNPGDTVYAQWLDCSKSGWVLHEWGECWWGISAEGVLEIVPKNGTEGVTSPLRGNLGNSPWYGYRTSVKALKNRGQIVLGAGSCCGLFYNCTSLADISALSSWNTAKVTGMNAMFFGCSSLSSVTALSSWNIAAVTNMNSMFSGCTSLADVSGLSSWNIAAVTNMNSMFSGCTSLADVSGLSSWNIAAVTVLDNVFSRCTALAKVVIPSATSTGRDKWVQIFKTMPSALLSATWTKGTASMTMNDILAKTTAADMNAVAGTWTRAGARSLSADLAPAALKAPEASFGIPSETPQVFSDSPVTTLGSEEPEASVVSTGTVGTGENTVGWSLDTDGVLTLHGGEGMTLEIPVNTSAYDNWAYGDGSKASDDLKDSVVAVRADGPIVVLGAQNLFSNFSKLEDISGLASFDVSNCLSMSAMFQNCSSLHDLSGLEGWRPGLAASGTVEMNYMFNRTGITTLDALGGWFDAREIGSGAAPSVRINGAFGHCTSLADASALRNWKVSFTETGRAFTDTPALTKIGIAYAASADGSSEALPWGGESNMVLPSLYVDNSYVQRSSTCWTSQLGEETVRTQTGGISWKGTTSGVYERVDDTKTVAFDANGGSGTVPEPVRFVWDDNAFGGSVTFPEATGLVAPSGKRFSEWNTKADGTGWGFAAGETFTTMWDVMGPYDSGLIMYAQWENAPVTVWFTDGVGIVSEQEVDPEAGIEEMPSIAAPAGKRHVAWEPANGTGEIMVGRPSGPIDPSWMDGDTVSFNPVFEDLPTSVEGEAGSYDFYLTAGQTVTLKGIPAGASYKVWEETEAGWQQISATGDTGTVKPGADSKAVFTNRYAPTETRAQVEAAKEVVGTNGMSPAGYAFELIDEGGNVVGSGTSGASGTVTILTPTITAPGTYTYKVREAAEQPAKPAGIAMDQDDTERTVTVTAADDGMGRLAAEVSYPGEGMTFTNVVEPGKVVVKKTVYAENSSKPDLTTRFNFRLTRADGTVEEFQLAHGETKEFSVPHGEKVQVEEVDLPSGYPATQMFVDDNYVSSEPSASTMSKSGNTSTVEIRNTYRPVAATVRLSSKKVVPTMEALPAFSFDLKLADMKNLDGTDGWGNASYTDSSPYRQYLYKDGSPLTVENYGDGTVRFPDLTLAMEGTYTFEISEQAGESTAYAYDGTVHTATVVVTDDGHGKLVATAPVYDTGSAPTFTNTVTTKTVEVEKRVESDFHTGEGERFSLRMHVGDIDADSLTALGITAAEAAGSLTVDGAPYTAGGIFEVAAGQTVTIEGPAAVIDAVETVSEDDAPGYTSEVTETDNDGTRHFTVTNRYEATGTFTVAATKTLDGEAPGEETFTFTLADEYGNTVARAKNDPTGTVSMTDVPANAPGTHRYSLTEVDDGRAGIVFDDREVAVEVFVEDVGEGRLECSVTYDGKTEPPTFANRRPGHVMPATGGPGTPLATALAGAGLTLAATLRRLRRRI